MTMSKQELRVELNAEIKLRNELMAQNSRLLDELRRVTERNKFLVETLGNPLVESTLLACASEVINVVIEHTIKASKAVVEQASETGDYVIGIDIDRIQIRRRLSGDDVDLASKAPQDKSTQPTPFKS